MSHPILKKLKEKSITTGNFLCVGLDPDPAKIPKTYSENIKGIHAFLEEVIRETEELVIAYKPNISFFEALGLEGLHCLESICKTLRSKNHIIILDGKRGDIGNTSAKQAQFMFDYFGADATTLNPYMGYDSMEPFLKYKDKFNFILALTSNSGSKDIQQEKLQNGKKIYEHTIETAINWNESHKNIGLVVGATNDTELQNCREKAQNLPFLMPGVGAQGGSYQNSAKLGQTKEGICIINTSRAVLYPQNGLTRKQIIEEILNS